MNHREAGYEAYLDFLKSLRESGAIYFMEGGQAVNFWAEYVDSSNPSQPLRLLRPFTSKDCDVWISHITWERLKRNPGGKLRKGTSPSDGQLGILTLNDDPLRVVDLMSNVYGIPSREYPRLLERVIDNGNIKVIDPLHLFLSKCHCLLGLDQSDRQDERHVRMMALIVPEYLSFLIDSIDGENLKERAILKEIKLLKKMLGTSACRRALKQLDLDPATLIPWSKLETCGLEVLAAFARTRRESRLP
ncbi:MAG: hypothetical protein V4584_10855 [Verrucomicrobiota bacterium]